MRLERLPHNVHGSCLPFGTIGGEALGNQWRHILRYSGLRDSDAEFQQLTVDAWCTPKKIRASHLADQLASLEGDPGAPTSPATTRSIFPNHSGTVTAPTQDRFGLSDFQCVAPGRPPPRHKDPEQPIDGAKTGTPRAAACEHGQLMLQCNALPNQCSAGTMIYPGSFNGVAVEPNHSQSLCPTGTIRQRSGSDEVLRCYGAGGKGVASFGR
jgi:hypothetical protein